MPKLKIKTCKKHGECEFVLETRGYYRCKKCRSERVTKNRQNRKKKLVELFGGKCEICGYSRCLKALHFHHYNPETKSFGLAEKGMCRSLARQKEEAAKCVLLCNRCHTEVEDGVIEMPREIIARF